MALTTREKKLAVGWLAEVAVTDFLVSEYCNSEIKAQTAKRKKKLRDQIMAGFSLEERAELDLLDAQIPKF